MRDRRVTTSEHAQAERIVRVLDEACRPMTVDEIAAVTCIERELVHSLCALYSTGTSYFVRRAADTYGLRRLWRDALRDKREREARTAESYAKLEAARANAHVDRQIDEAMAAIDHELLGKDADQPLTDEE